MLPGGAVAGAAVSVTAVTDAIVAQRRDRRERSYTFATLPPGDYMVRITANGFKTFAKQHVPVTLNRVSRVDASLEVGEVNQTVEVTGAAPALQTDRATSDHDITAETIENLPLPPGNNFESLIRDYSGRQSAHHRALDSDESLPRAGVQRERHQRVWKRHPNRWREPVQYLGAGKRSVYPVLGCHPGG